jgi:hypothetical protein
MRLFALGDAMQFHKRNENHDQSHQKYRTFPADRLGLLLAGVPACPS